MITAVTTWVETHPIMAGITAAVAIATAVIALRLITAATRSIRTATKGRAVHIITLAVVIMATGLSLDGMWEFLHHQLGLTDWRLLAFVGVLDGSALACGFIARRDRLRDPEKMSRASVLVWIIATISGVLSATEATGWGSVARFLVPILAAILADFLLHSDVRVIDKTSVATVSGRVSTALARAWASLMRGLARAGIIHPSDGDIHSAAVERWHRAVVTAYDRAELHPIIDGTKPKRRAVRARRRLQRLIAKGVRLGVLCDQADRDRLVRDLAAVANVRGLIDQIKSVDPWAPKPVGRPTDRSTDRPDRPVDLFGRPIDTSELDHVLDQILGRPITTEEPPADRPRRVDLPEGSINRPVDPDRPKLPKRDRNRPARKPRTADRSAVETTRRRTKAETEALIKNALAAVLDDAGAEEITADTMPSHAEIATMAAVSKSTVTDFLRRSGISQRQRLTRADTE